MNASKITMTLDEVSDDQAAVRGALLAKVLKLKRDRVYPDRWQTEDGTKTGLGIFRMCERMMLDGE